MCIYTYVYANVYHMYTILHKRHRQHCIHAVYVYTYIRIHTCENQRDTVLRKWHLQHVQELVSPHLVNLFLPLFLGIFLSRPSSYFTAQVWSFSVSQAGFSLCEWPLYEGGSPAQSGTLSLPSVTSSSHASRLKGDASQHLPPA